MMEPRHGLVVSPPEPPSSCLARGGPHPVLNQPTVLLSTPHLQLPTPATFHVRTCMSSSCSGTPSTRISPCAGG